MKRTRGFALLSAIFILVVLATLGAFILNVSSSQQIGSALDIQGVRAYQAARAGIEWGVHQVQSFDPTGATTTGDGYRFGYDCVATDTGSTCPNRRRCPGGALASTDSFAVLGMTVTVGCTATEDPLFGPTIYVLTATACSQPVTGWTATTLACPNTADPNNLYVERRLDVSF